jgi:hypothetical protein
MNTLNQRQDTVSGPALLFSSNTQNQLNLTERFQPFWEQYMAFIGQSKNTEPEFLKEITRILLQSAPVDAISRTSESEGRGCVYCSAGYWVIKHRSWVLFPIIWIMRWKRSPLSRFYLDIRLWDSYTPLSPIQNETLHKSLNMFEDYLRSATLENRVRQNKAASTIEWIREASKNRIAKIWLTAFKEEEIGTMDYIEQKTQSLHAEITEIDKYIKLIDAQIGNLEKIPKARTWWWISAIQDVKNRILELDDISGIEASRGRVKMIRKKIKTLLSEIDELCKSDTQEYRKQDALKLAQLTTERQGLLTKKEWINKKLSVFAIRKQVLSELLGTENMTEAA